MDIWWWLLTGFALVGFFLGAVALFASHRALMFSRQRWSDSGAVRMIDALRTEVADLNEKMGYQNSQYRKLLARINKRDKSGGSPPAPADADLPLANPTPVPDVEPNPFTEPEAWKRYKRIQLAQRR